MNYVWHFEVVWRNLYPLFYSGMLMTFQLTLSAFLLGLIAGTLAAFGRLSRYRLIRAVFTAYVEFVRNTPFLVQLYLVYFGFSSFQFDLRSLGLAPYRIDFTPFQSALIALVFNTGGYTAEIVRAGIQAVSHGEIEAAQSTGLSFLQITRFIVLPRALVIVYPPLVNQLILTLLGSSVASLVTVPELSFQAEWLNYKTFRTLEIYIGLGLMYLLLNWAVALFFYLMRRACFRRPLPQIP